MGKLGSIASNDGIMGNMMGITALDRNSWVEKEIMKIVNGVPFT